MKQTITALPRRKSCVALLAACALLVLVGCNTSFGVGMGTGGTRVGVGAGGGGTTIGVGTRTGTGVSLSGYKDFLNNGPDEAYTTNQEGLKALDKEDFTTARSLFEKTLAKYPEHPDATYFLGLTKIYQDEREAGFALLESYREPRYYRMTSEVQRTAKYLKEKPELTPDKIHETMNRNRTDGYNRDLRERQEMFD